jgi:hypothetical protein
MPLLAENDAQFRCAGTDHLNGRLTVAARSTHRLAIDAKAAFHGANPLGYPATEGHLELLRARSLMPWTASQTERTAAMAITRISTNSCKLPLLGLRGSTTSIKPRIGPAPFVTRMAPAQKTRADLSPWRFTSHCRTPMTYNALQLPSRAKEPMSSECGGTLEKWHRSPVWHSIPSAQRRDRKAAWGGHRKCLRQRPRLSAHGGKNLLLANGFSLQTLPDICYSSRF